MFKQPAWIEGHQISRCVPPAASQETRTGYRVSLRVELAVQGKRRPEALGRVQCSCSQVYLRRGTGAVALWVSLADAYQICRHHTFGSVANLSIPSGSPFLVR